ncbi:hypothetical protein C8R45DRAFT_1136067 [Mycena sanguinolenta]|nr:hypothetical protein C8R45DRAFT_1136067 [Mycena sanguinolenta]
MSSSNSPLTSTPSTSNGSPPSKSPTMPLVPASPPGPFPNCSASPAESLVPPVVTLSVHDDTSDQEAEEGGPLQNLGPVKNDSVATVDETPGYEWDEDDAPTQSLGPVANNSTRSDDSSDNSGQEDEEEWGGISPGTTAPKFASKPISRLHDSDSDSGADLPKVHGLTSWAKRNPGRPVFQGKPKAKRVLGPEQRRTLHDRAKSRKHRMASLQEIVLLNHTRSEMVTELSTKHKFKPKLVRQRLMASNVLKPTRQTSLYCAKLYYLAKLTQNLIGLAENERLSLHNIRRRAITSPEFQNMSNEFKRKLIVDLDEHKLTKQRGIRATDKLVAQDAGATLIWMKMGNLFEHSSMAGLAIFSKGHVQDRFIPWILESAEAGDFLRESPNIEPMDFIAKFEQWCCAQEKGATGSDTLQSMRKQVTKMMKAGLTIASGRQKCVMNYERYIKAIVLGYGCMVVGHPKDTFFSNYLGDYSACCKRLNAADLAFLRLSCWLSLIQCANVGADFATVSRKRDICHSVVTDSVTPHQNQRKSNFRDAKHLWGVSGILVNGRDSTRPAQVDLADLSLSRGNISVDFTSVTNITSIDDMQILRDTWKDGTCHWKVLLAREKEEWWEKYRKMVEDGDIVEQPRKRRCDKDVQRGANKRTKSKQAAVDKSSQKSKVVVEDEESDTSSESRGEDEEDEGEDEDVDNVDSDDEEPMPVKKTSAERKWWQDALDRAQPAKVKAVAKEAELREKEKRASKPKAAREKEKASRVKEKSGSKEKQAREKEKASNGKEKSVLKEKAVLKEKGGKAGRKSKSAEEEADHVNVVRKRKAREDDNGNDQAGRSKRAKRSQGTG